MFAYIVPADTVALPSLATGHCLTGSCPERVAASADGGATGLTSYVPDAEHSAHQAEARARVEPLPIWKV